MKHWTCVLPAVVVCGLLDPTWQQAVAVEPKGLSASFTDHGAIQSLTWNRPAVAPVNMVFRQDRFVGFAFHVEAGGKLDAQLPLVRVRPGCDEFALNRCGVIYSLAYTTTHAVLEICVRIKNDSGKPFSPDLVRVNVGVDTEMAKYPEWNQRFFPTLLRCEKTHFWGYFMRPDGVILGIASPDPIASWANGYNHGGRRKGNVRAGLTWFGPGGCPEEIR